MGNSKETLILTLAEKLVGKQVDTKTITDGLNLICDSYGFDCGLVYEIDQYNWLRLKETDLKIAFDPVESFIIDTIQPKYRKQLAEKGLSYLYKNNHNTVTETKMLDFFKADTLVIFPIIDETTRINALIVFLNISPKAILTEDALHTLSLAFSLLGRCIEVRVYQNKTTFTEASFDSILDNTGIDIYVNDFNTHDILYINKSMAAPYGGVEAFKGKRCWEVLFPGQGGPCDFCPQEMITDEDGHPTKIYTWDYQRAYDGSWFRVFSAAFRWIDGRLAHVVSSADITDNKQQEALIEYMANYDSLTNLPNRRMLVSECERRIDAVGLDKADANGISGFLLFFDIDGFKAINDTYGHDAGDEFLIQLGAFFSDVPMLKDNIYRNGGDEFVALLDGNVTQGNISSLIHFIHERFKKPWILKKGNVYCNTSVGVACFPKDGTNAETLLQVADKAMYLAKKSGGGRACFGYELDEF